MRGDSAEMRSTLIKGRRGGSAPLRRSKHRDVIARGWQRLGCCSAGLPAPEKVSCEFCWAKIYSRLKPVSSRGDADLSEMGSTLSFPSPLKLLHEALPILPFNLVPPSAPSNLGMLLELRERRPSAWSLKLKLLPID